MKHGRLQAKDIPDEPLLAFIRKIEDERGMWTNRWEIEAEFPQWPPKVITAKLAKMKRRGLVDGCECGCRGGWELADRAQRYAAKWNEGVS